MFSLYEAFKSIKNEKEFTDFMADLCTPGEIKDLNDRFMIVQLLKGGEHSQRAIADMTGCSIATVTRVARFLNHESHGGYRKILDNLFNQKK